MGLPKLRQLFLSLAFVGEEKVTNSANYYYMDPLVPFRN